MFDDTCGTCVHYQGAQDAAQGSCMRYPPTPVPIMQPQAPAVLTAGNQGQQPQGFGVMSVRAPVTADTPACGEHETPEDESIPVGGTD